MSFFKKKRCVIFFVLLLFAVGCQNLGQPIVSEEERPIINHYLDIPGITQEEIDIIETYQKQAKTFVYGMIPSTESFVDFDGELRGFAPLVCEWLTDIFGITFVPANFSYPDLLGGLKDGSVHFTGHLTPSPENQTIYIMTAPIAQRTAKYFHYLGSIETESDFDDVNDLVFSAVSFAAQDPDLTAFVSVTQKLLENNGTRQFSALYSEGYNDYLKHKFLSKLTAEEIAFIRENPIIPVAAEFDNYPVSFFNERSGLWQGIAFDVLDEVGTLTGLQFKIVNEPTVEFYELLRMTREGEVYVLTEALHSPEREEYFLWAETPLAEIKIALISKSEMPNISINDIYTLRVGQIRGSLYVDLFNKWFPNHPFIYEFDSQDDVFAALVDGDVDVVVNNTIGHLRLINYQELVGYKINYTFDAAKFESTLVINRKNATPLHSIINKAMLLIDVETISGQWLHRSYDYRVRLLEEREQVRRPWIIGASVLVAIIIILILIMYFRNRNAKIRMEELVKIRTSELAYQRTVAVQANQVKSEFLAVMSHEIRTPMNSIMGFAELAQSIEKIPIQAIEYLDRIIDNTKWLLKIVNDILDISKIEAGKMELESVPFDLREVVSRCQSVILPNIKEKGLELSVYAELPPGKMLIGDPVRLYQILLNILSNAVKFTETGTIKLAVSIEEVDENHVEASFSIEDSGIGMSPEQVDIILEPFAQADSSITRNYGGTGLGLTIAKNIIDNMGGTLKVDSEAETGSTFSFKIIFETTEITDEAIEHIAPVIIEKPHFDGLVLVCDDNYMNRHVMNDHLSNVGLRSVVAENGKIAVEKVVERIEKGGLPFDLILMDIFMPVMDGIEAAMNISKLGLKTPIIAVTANMMSDEVDKYLSYGMSDCLGKPFTSQELWHILLKYLTPVGSSEYNEAEQLKRDDKLLNTLLRNFPIDNQDKVNEINEAISLGDIKLAHRLAHTLKGNAGLINKTKLYNAASEVESLLEARMNTPGDIGTDVFKIIKRLDTELAVVLDQLKPLAGELEEEVVEPLDKQQALALLKELQTMLKRKNPGCVNKLAELRAIPDSGELAAHIEKYQFKPALEALRELMEKGGYEDE